MRFLRNEYLGLLTLVFGTVAIVTPNADAQLFDGRLPKIFNRDKVDPEKPIPINRNSPDDIFTRELGSPTPIAVKVQTIKGRQVAFYITARTRIPGMRVDFLVRDYPSAGEIISIISSPENRSTAVVTYLADPNSGATQDTFSFAARYPGGEYSTATRCLIEIRDAQALIELSPKADFGTVQVGKSEEREISIINQGNGPFATTMNLPPPWKVTYPEGGRIQLPPGRQIWMKVAYTPTFGGPSGYDIILNRGKKGMCKLSGRGEVPFSVKSDQWEMTVNPETGCRECDVLVNTHHERPVEVFLRTSSRLKTRGSEYTVLLPDRDNRIRLYLEKEDVMPFEGALEIKIKEGFKVSTGVFGNSVPSNLEVEIPGQIVAEVINFGKVIAGRSSERGIILKNIGGELCPIDASVAEPFRILTDTDRQLVPKESMQVSIGFYPHKADRGAADQMLFLRTDRQEVKIRLVGNALRPPGVARERKPPLVSRPVPKPVEPIPTPPPVHKPEPKSSDFEIGSGNSAPRVSSPDRLKTASPKDSSTYRIGNRNRREVDISMSPFGMPTRGIVQRDFAPGLRDAVDFQLLRAKAKSLDIGWTAPKGSELDTFELEMRGQRINPITSGLESVWAPYPGVEYERVGRLVKARVQGLNPYAFYEFRVFTIDQNGRSSPPSVAFGLRTTRTMDWTYIYATLGVILLGLLVWAIVKIVRDRRGEVYQSQYLA